MPVTTSTFELASVAHNLNFLIKSASKDCDVEDFNEILLAHEKEWGGIRSDREMEAFRQCICECGLSELGFRGNAFTLSWRNMVVSVTRERLNHFITSVGWVC